MSDRACEGVPVVLAAGHHVENLPQFGLVSIQVGGKLPGRFLHVRQFGRLRHRYEFRHQRAGVPEALPPRLQRARLLNGDVIDELDPEGRQS